MAMCIKVWKELSEKELGITTTTRTTSKRCKRCKRCKECQDETEARVMRQERQMLNEAGLLRIAPVRMSSKVFGLDNSWDSGMLQGRCAKIIGRTSYKRLTSPKTTVRHNGLCANCSLIQIWIVGVAGIGIWSLPAACGW